MRAEGWVIKGRKLTRSQKVRKLYGPEPLDPKWVYSCLMASVDSWGMMPGDASTLKSELGPFDDHHTGADYLEAVNRLLAVSLLCRWTIQGDPWLYVVGHDEENRAKRRAANPLVFRPAIGLLNGSAAELGELNCVNNTTVTTKSGVSQESVTTKSGLSPDLVSHPPARAGLGIGKGKGKGEGREDQTESPISLLQDKRPEAWELVTIQELQQLHAELHQIQDPILMNPTGDNLWRVLLTIRHPELGDGTKNIANLKAIILGHHKLAAKNESMGVEFRNVFPPLRSNGKSVSNKIDVDRLLEFLAAGRKLKIHVQDHTKTITVVRAGKKIKINPWTKEETIIEGTE